MKIISYILTITGAVSSGYGVCGLINNIENMGLWWLAVIVLGIVSMSINIPALLFNNSKPTENK